MDFLKIKKVIEKNQIIYSGDDKSNSLNHLSFPKEQLFDTFKMALKEYKKPDNNCSLNALCLAEKRSEYQPQLIDCLTRSNEGDFLTKISQLPCSFRVTNIQLYNTFIKPSHHSAFKQHRLLFNSNIYCTPGKQRNALALHTDYEDLFVLQLSGRKKWALVDLVQLERDPRLNTAVQLNEFLSSTSIKELPKQAVSYLTLDEGDMLFLPKLTPHQAVAINDEPSIHLTHGFRPQANNADFLPFALTYLKEHYVAHHLDSNALSLSDNINAYKELLLSMSKQDLGKQYHLQDAIKRMEFFRYGYPYGHYHLRQNN